MEREKIVKNLKKQIKNGKHIIGVATCSGMTARYARQGGADFLLMLNSGRFREMGRSSLAGFLPFYNSNDMVMDFASKEIITLVKEMPVIFGLNATDPTKDMESYIDEIKSMGFSGVNNYPTVGLIDGEFGKMIEKAGCCYDSEVKAISTAHKKDMFTVAFVFNEGQAVKMINAGADVICVHLGLTEGGLLGAKRFFSLEAAKNKINKIFKRCDKINSDIIKLIYGGPVKTPSDVEYMYSCNKDIMGYIGGSAFERIPSEKLIISTTRAFKVSGEINKDEIVTKHYDYVEYVEYVKEYVAQNYMRNISFLNLAKSMYVSRGYLSSLFKKKVGCGFPQYLVEFRMNKSQEILECRKDIQLSELSSLVGYEDYAQFSKMFKRYEGCTPKEFKSKISKNMT